MVIVMNIWAICWQCKHDTFQERLILRIYPRVQEAFSKNENGHHKNSIWMVFVDAYQFCECKKCQAPNLHRDEYWTKTNEGIKVTGEAQTLSTQIKEKGFCDGYDFKRQSFPQLQILDNYRWSFNLPEEEMLLFWEILSAWEKNLYVLALSGIRTMIDRYMVRKVGDIGNFQTKLENLLKQGHVNKTQYELLGTAIEAGNAAAHRGFRPEKEMLSDLLKVVEDIIALEYKTLNFDGYKVKIPQRSSDKK